MPYTHTLFGGAGDKTYVESSEMDDSVDRNSQLYINLLSNHKKRLFYEGACLSVPVSKKLESNYVLHLQGNYSDCHVGALI